jgi:hypothetical protein
MGVARPVSIETLKQQRKELLNDIESLWGIRIGQLPTLPLRRTDAKYVVTTDAIVGDDSSSSSSGSWIKDVQEFYPGQEIDLLDYVEHIYTEFRTSHIIVCIRDITGFIEHTVTVKSFPQ